MRWMRHIARFIVSAIVLLLVAALVPGFSISGFGSALFAAFVIALVGWIVEAVFGKEISPYARGLVGFLVSAAVLYFVQFFVPGFRIGIFSALIAAFIIGVIDLFVPTVRSKAKS